MDESEVRAALALDELEDAADLLEGWSASQTALPIGTLFFLAPSYLTAAGRRARHDAELLEAMLAAANRIASDPAACALAWHVYHRLFRVPAFDPASTRRWPTSIPSLGDESGLLYLLAILGGLPDLYEIYHAHDVPDWVARDTLYDVQRWAGHYRRHHGIWGIEPSSLWWLRHHLRGELYGLGRLQFMPGPWTVEARAFRHRVSGRVVALSEDGVRYRSDGQRDGAGGVRDRTRAWRATLEHGQGWVAGHVITPNGSAEYERTRLPLDAWEEVLAPGATVLDMHIPRGVPLDTEACRHSLQEALRFFPAHFPELPFVAFTCESWLLDAQLEQLLPPSSNLVRFLRQLYLVPLAADSAATLEWVFDGVPEDLATAPRDTLLRRAVLNHLGSGGHLRPGAGFLLRQDAGAWGSDVYRTSQSVVRSNRGV